MMPYLTAAAQDAAPVPPTAADMQRLLAEWQSLQVQLSHVAEALEKYRASVAAELAATEAQKKTLIEWLEQAQAQAPK
jgi:hypothetical protein